MVGVARTADAYEHTHYPFARSPDEAKIDAHFLECEKSLVQGIESGKGIYQFVSRKAHFTPADSKEKPIIGALQTQWKNSRQCNTDLILGGRFKVVSIVPPERELSVKVGHGYHVDDMHLNCTLTVVDINADATNPANHRAIPLTQAGLKFTGKVLKAVQIVHASNVMTEHLEKCQPPLQGAQHQSLPLVTSAAKRGRGPTLIVFHEITSQIKAGIVTDAKSIDAALSAIITTGREARIASHVSEKSEPDLNGFVHSAHQLQELRTALIEELARKNSRCA